MSTYVPSKDDEDGPHGHLADEPLEALLGLARCILEHIVADFEEVVGPLQCCRNLPTCVSNGPAHLDRELRGQLILFLAENIQCLLDDVFTFL
jgi:hypothetical protein